MAMSVTPEQLRRILEEAVAPLSEEIGALRREITTLRNRLGEATLSQKEVCARYDVSPSTVLRRQQEGALTRLGTERRARYCARECERVFRPRKPYGP